MFILLLSFLIIFILYISFNLIKRRNLLNEKHKNVIFLNAWKPSDSLVYEDFINALNDSHLLSFSEGISLARDSQTEELLKGCGFKDIEILPNFDEFNMLEKIINHCNNNDNNENYVLYIHFKGSYHNSRDNKELRKMLIYYVITNYDKCITKLKNGADVCGSRYSLFPYRHYSGNMWWSKCKYIQTLKNPKYTLLNKRYSVGFDGYKGDRYSAEKWIMSNSKSIPSDLMSDDIDFSFGYGNDDLYKTWITKPQNIKYAPNIKTLYSTIRYNEYLSFFPHTYYSLYFNLFYDYEVYYNFNRTSLFNLGWCKGILSSKLYDESNDDDDELMDMVNNLIEYCKIAQGLRIKNISNNIKKYKTSDKDIIYLSNMKCDEYNNNNNNEYDVICNENEDINYDYQVIYNICSKESLNKDIYYSQNYNDILNLRLKCDKSKDFCGKWFIYPFRGSNIGWKASCQFIRNAGKPKYYLYEGIKLEDDDSFYGFNKYSYLHWPLTNPFQSGNCDELSKSILNIQVLYSVLLNTVFDIESNVLDKENLHKCYWWCNCFSFNKTERINESLYYFCNICNN